MWDGVESSHITNMIKGQLLSKEPMGEWIIGERIAIEKVNKLRQIGTK